MIGFIGPALTAGAITGERERQTYDLLRTTLISPRMLVLGKLVSACAYLFLLVFAATPIQALAFLLGGIGPEEIFVSTLILLVNIVFFCALGLLCSSFSRRTLTATITSYSIILLSLLATGLILYVFIQVIQKIPYLSPEYGIWNVFIWYFCSINSLLTGLLSEGFLITNHVLFYGASPFIDPNGQNIFIFSPWVLHVPLVAILSTVMVLSSILFVNRAER
jgi:ABC-type transport system involved in multi-copper enzyme maturation permease subunit